MKFASFFIILFAYHFTAKSQISSGTKPAENTVQNYIPLPMDDIYKAAFANRNAENEKSIKQITNFLDYYKTISSFKSLSNGTYSIKAIVDSHYITDAKVSIVNNRINLLTFSKNAYNADNGLKVNSDVINGHTKVFVVMDGNYFPIEIFVLDSFQ